MLYKFELDGKNYEAEVVCTAPANRGVPPSMSDPGEPATGREFEVTDFYLVGPNGRKRLDPRRSKKYEELEQFVVEHFEAIDRLFDEEIRDGRDAAAEARLDAQREG